MEVLIHIPAYDPEKGFTYSWEKGFEISVEQKDQTMIITANKEGLVSLAKQLLSLAQDSVPDNYHLHLDAFNSLEENSCELIIQKKA